MKIDKFEFIYNPTLLSNHLLSKAFNLLTEEQRNALINADNFKISMTINGIEIPFPKIEEFLQSAMLEQFNHCMNEYLGEKYENAFSILKNKFVDMTNQIDLLQDEITEELNGFKENIKELTHPIKSEGENDNK